MWPDSSGEEANIKAPGRKEAPLARRPAASAKASSRMESSLLTLREFTIRYYSLLEGQQLFF